MAYLIAENRTIGPDSRRLETLSRPKTNRTPWIRTLGRELNWGDQESLWPVSKAALETTPTERLTSLANPKKDFQTSDGKRQHIFSCGRTSVIWDVAPSAMNAKASERVQQLAMPKKPSEKFLEDRPLHVFSCGRTSPIWQASKAQHSPMSQDTIDRLSTPRPVAQPVSDTMMTGRYTVAPSALKGRATPRVLELAQARSRPDGPYRDSQWPISRATLSRDASPRIVEMAKPRPFPEGYKVPRTSVWRVSEAAKRAEVRSRYRLLAIPRQRASMTSCLYDPNAFDVKPEALKAKCSARTEELAQPKNYHDFN